MSIVLVTILYKEGVNLMSALVNHIFFTNVIHKHHEKNKFQEPPKIDDRIKPEKNKSSLELNNKWIDNLLLSRKNRLKKNESFESDFKMMLVDLEDTVSDFIFSINNNEEVLKCKKKSDYSISNEIRKKYNRINKSTGSESDKKIGRLEILCALYELEKTIESESKNLALH